MIGMRYVKYAFGNKVSVQPRALDIYIILMSCYIICFGLGLEHLSLDLELLSLNSKPGRK